MIDCNNKKCFVITFGPKKTPFTINNGVVPGSWVDTAGDNGRSEHVLSGIKVHTNINGEGVPIIGIMPNNGEINGSIDGLNTEVYTLPVGYISGGNVHLTDDIKDYLESLSGKDGETIMSQLLIIESLIDELGETISWLGGSAPDPVVLSNISEALREMLRFETEDDNILVLENGDVLCREHIQGGY